MVSNCLSHDFHLDDPALTNLISSYAHDQVPFGFSLCQLPTEISSWLTCLLRNQPSTKLWCKEPMRSKLSLGNVINNTSCPSEYTQTGTSTTSPDTKNTESLEPLQQHYEKADLALKKFLPQNQIPYSPPWIAWLRPLSWLTELTQGSTQTPTLHSFYNDNFEPTKDLTNKKDNRSPSPDPFSGNSSNLPSPPPTEP